MPGLALNKKEKGLAHAATAAHTTHEAMMIDGVNSQTRAGGTVNFVCFDLFFHCFVI